VPKLGAAWTYWLIGAQCASLYGSPVQQLLNEQCTES
jgi:hypothetical protein